MVSLEVWVCCSLKECRSQSCFGSARNVEETKTTIRRVSVEDFLLGYLEQVCIYEFLCLGEEVIGVGHPGVNDIEALL